MRLNSLSLPQANTRRERKREREIDPGGEKWNWEEETKRSWERGNEPNRLFFFLSEKLQESERESQREFLWELKLVADKNGGGWCWKESSEGVREHEGSDRIYSGKTFSGELSQDVYSLIYFRGDATDINSDTVVWLMENDLKIQIHLTGTDGYSP